MRKQEKTFLQARINMVDSQIHPMGVNDEVILKSFETVPREAYVPEFQRGIAYCDEDIEVAPGRYLMEASIIARLYQAAEVQEEDVALVIGSTLGYAAAVLSYLVMTVVALEQDLALTKQAQKSWDEHSNANIAGITGVMAMGHEECKPYDVIFINGAVAYVPDNIREQLAVGGRLITLIKDAGQSVAKAVLITRVSEDDYHTEELFEAGTPYLMGFEPVPEFKFA